MGQRHQLFVIARINGKYRSLSAVHHQWLYGHTALRRCRDLLQIFSSPSNRIPLIQDLKEAESRGPDFWKHSGSPRSPQDLLPFPFITSCLTLGASFNPEDGYSHMVHLEDYLMAYNEGDNNNGITIIDISDLDRLRYCYVDFYGMESDREVQLMAPLSARIYLEAYYDLTDPDYKWLESCVDMLEPWHIVTTEALEDTWPGQGWEEPNSFKMENSPSSNMTASPEDQPQHIRSLRDSAFDQLADAVIEDADVSLNDVIEAQRMNDFWRKFRIRLSEKTRGKAFSDRLLDLLFRSMEFETNVDLSQFDSMQSGQVASLIDRLLTRDSQARSLNVSGLQLSKEDVKYILRKAGGLKALYMSGDSPVQLSEIADCKPSFDVYQTDLLQRPWVSNGRFPRIEAGTPDLLDFSCGSHPVVQIAWLGLGEYFLRNRDSYDATGHLKYSDMICAKDKSYILASFPDRKRPMCCQCSLTDVPLPLPRLVGGLKVFLQWLSGIEQYVLSQCAFLHQGIASSFAIGKLEDGMLEPGVGPMSAGLYQSYGAYNITGSPLRPGQWAVFVIHPFSGRAPPSDDTGFQEAHSVMTEMSKGNDFDLTKVHYALVGAGEGSGSYKVADIPQYLELVGTKEAEELRSWWKTRVESLPYINYFDRPDVLAMAQEVFRPSVEVDVGLQE